MTKVPFRWHRLGWHLSIWLWRPTVHWLIFRYTCAVGGSFHHREYGPNGRYIVVMNEDEYHQFTTKVRDK